MAFGQSRPFAQSSIAVVNASTTSASAPVVPGGDVALITNTTTALARVSFGSGSTPTAVAGSGYPVLPGTQRAVFIGPMATSVAAILATGTGSIYVEVGNGVGH